MKIFINVLLIVIAVILQITFMPKIAFLGAFPNLILLVALSLIFIKKIEEALLWIGLGGILLDLFSPVHFGVYIVSLILIFAISYYLVNYVFSDFSLFLAAAIFFISSIIFNIIFLLYTHYFNLYLLEAVYTTLLGCMIYGIIRYYYKPSEEVKI